MTATELLLWLASAWSAFFLYALADAPRADRPLDAGPPMTGHPLDGARDDEPDDDMDVADQVAYEDTGRPWGARAIKHPSHSRTRAHFAANPLPAQQDRRAS